MGRAVEGIWHKQIYVTKNLITFQTISVFSLPWLLLIVCKAEDQKWHQTLFIVRFISLVGFLSTDEWPEKQIFTHLELIPIHTNLETTYLILVYESPFFILNITQE